MGERLRVDLDGTHEHVCLGCIWGTKETQHAKVISQRRGFPETIKHHLQHATVVTRQRVELLASREARVGANAGARGKHEIHKVCTHAVLSYSTHTRAHPQMGAFTQARSQQASNSQSSCRLSRLCYPVAYSWRWISRAPLRKTTLPGMSRNVNCRRLSPRSDTDGCDGKVRRSHTEAG